jgi:hypothetical protein
MASKEERDARLDELADATRKWAENRREELNAQVALGKRILKGRTGSERLADAPVQSVSDLTVDEINQFLTG